jgi:paraquat-inducible protein A
MKSSFARTRRSLRALLPWPKPPGKHHRSVCHFCDTLHLAEPLAEGVAARCKCCGAVLYQNRPASLARATAFSVTGLILMVVVHVFPFLTMDAASIRTTLNLTSAAWALFNQDSPLLGMALVLFTMVAPLSMASGLIYVCAPLMFGRIAPGAFLVAKWLNKTEPWNMIEVFLLGVLVSLLKLAKVADVHFGIGFWAFGLLMLCMAAAVAGIDRDELWDRLEVAKP